MVKILANFSDVEEQKLLSPKGEPHTIYCSSDCLFMALDNCIVEVYQAETVQLVAQVRTVGPVLKLVYNKPWDCIVTLERKHSDTRNFVRVYFNWRGASSERPVRIGRLESPQDGSDPSSSSPSSFSSSSSSSSSAGSVEIVELPTEDDRHVKCLAACERTGIIAVGSDGLLRLFTIRKTFTAKRVISTLCDVSLEMDVVKITVFCNYVACISSSEVRVLKICWLDGQEDSRYGLKTYAPSPPSPQPPNPSGPNPAPFTSADIGLDATFVEWSPCCVRDAKGNVSSTVELRPDPPTFPSSSSSSSSPSVGFLSLKSIAKAAGQNEDSEYLNEVLGPVEATGGQQVDIEACSGESGEQVKCRVVTMLYRRFVPKAKGATVPDQKSKSTTLAAAEAGGSWKAGEAKGRTATLPLSGEQKSKGASALPENLRDAPHTVELLPTLVEGPSGTVLVGLACFVATQHQGCIYDVHQRTRRVSTFSFNSNTLAASCGTGLLYTLSEDSLDAYTSRVFPSCVAQSPSCSRCVGSDDVGGTDKLAQLWLCQPCPSSSMDMTLISTNKFIGAHSMACCKGYMVVLTKEVSAASASQESAYASSWLLQSLPLRRPVKTQPREASWNVYVLKMKPHEAMYQQFLEFATTLKDSSPPMYQHVLKEGHLLLRSELLYNWPPSSAKVKLLRENCLDLATSLCAYPTIDRETSTSAIAEYFIMSGCPIAQVVNLITSLASQSKTKQEQEQVLYCYLEMVLFEQTNALKEGAALATLGNQLLNFYADHRPHRLSSLLLYSWYQQYDKEKALGVLESCLKSSSSDSSPLILLCQAYLCLQLQQSSEAARKLNQVPKDFLVQWMNQHPEFVVDQNKTCITSFGKLISANQGSCIMDFITHCASHEELSFQQLCSVLKLSENTVLKQFLEKVVLGHIAIPMWQADCIQKAVLLLAELLVTRALTEDGVVSSSGTSSSSAIMFDTRYKWLDSIIPADSYCNTADAKELESLLCSGHINLEVACSVNKQLDDMGKEILETLPLRLLTWPHMGKLEEATQLVLTVCPSVMMDFCVTYFGKELSRWKWLLTILLEEIQHAVLPKTTVCSSVLRRTLDYVVTITTVEEFVGLLPQNGSLAFFLPSLEHSCKLFMSRQIAQQLQRDLAT